MKEGKWVYHCEKRTLLVCNIFLIVGSKQVHILVGSKQVHILVGSKQIIF